MDSKWAFIGGGSALLVAGLYATQSGLLTGSTEPPRPTPLALASATPEPETPAAPAIAESEAAVARLTASLAEQEAENARLRQTLAVRDGVLQTLQATVAEREAALDDLKAQLAASDAQLRTLQATLADLQARPGLDPTLAAFTPPASSSATRLEAVRTDAAGLDALFAEKASAALWTPPASTRPITVEVVFDFASAALTPGAVANTAAAAVTLADMSLERIRVVGHTDRVGSPAANRRLAEKRARAVADALIAAGLPADLIETDGMGETDAPVATDDGVPEPMNRSVAIIAVPHPIS